MKHLKVFEDFKDSTPTRANLLLKQIDKVLRYNLQYGALAKKGYYYEHSDIYDDKGPYDWLKMEIYGEKDDTEYRWNVIFMIDEEFLSEDAVEGEEKIHIEIYKYKLPEYKKIVSIKKSVALKELLEDEYLVKEIEAADKNVLKVPQDETEYKDNLKRQIDTLKDSF